ncbi:zinc finger protein 512B-like [Nasonia vitripennis]|uniref:Uncharacterized protein n=1 Tax=Nasonia vitripennis TaxID=7425 RepID=A0A7M7IKW8_NASVI|nr:zinc finger protein 512B-like [Nasonia vitripennis]
MIYSVLATITLLLLKCISAEYGSSANSGWQQYASQGISNFGRNDLNYGGQRQDFSILGSHGGGWHNGGGWSGAGGWNGHIGISSSGWNHNQHNDHHTAGIPIGEHIEITKPIAIPVIKNIGIPLAQPIGIPVAHVTAVGVPQPYPIHVPIAHPVAIPVIKTVATIIAKKVPYPIEKVIPVPVEKPIPIHIEKHIPVPVEKPYPVHVPVYKHVFHHRKSHGWRR